MSSFLDKMRGRSKGSSATAKERLQFILIHDRIDLAPHRLEAMKNELLEVISKYFAVDGDHVDIALQQRNHSNLLVAEIPFSRQAGLHGTGNLLAEDARPGD